jgi:hypothetical protein
MVRKIWHQLLISSRALDAFPEKTSKDGASRRAGRQMRIQKTTALSTTKTRNEHKMKAYRSIHHGQGAK